MISQCLSMISAKFLEYADRQTIGLSPFFFIICSIFVFSKVKDLEKKKKMAMIDLKG